MILLSVRNRKILIQGIYCKAGAFVAKWFLFENYNISTRRFSRLIINPKLSSLTLNFAHIWNSRLAVPRHSGLNNSDYHKDTLTSTYGTYENYLLFIHTRATEKQNTDETQAILWLFSFLPVLPHAIITRQVITSWTSVGKFQLPWLWLRLKILWGETSLLCFK